MSGLSKRCFRLVPLFWLLVAIGLLNLVDYLATTDLIVQGPHLEGNPLLRAIVGTPYFGLYKLLFVPLGLVFLWFARRAAAKYLGLIKVTCGVYLAVVVYTLVVFYL